MDSQAPSRHCAIWGFIFMNAGLGPCARHHHREVCGSRSTGRIPASLLSHCRWSTRCYLWKTASWSNLPPSPAPPSHGQPRDLIGPSVCTGLRAAGPAPPGAASRGRPCALHAHFLPILLFGVPGHACLDTEHRPVPVTLRSIPSLSGCAKV